MGANICEHCIELVDQADECVQTFLRRPDQDVPMVKLDTLRTLVRFAYRVRVSGYRCGWESEVLREIMTNYVFSHYNIIGGHFRDVAFKAESWFPVEYPSGIHDLEYSLGNYSKVVIYPGFNDEIMQNYTRCLDDRLIRKLYGETNQEDEK